MQKSLLLPSSDDNDCKKDRKQGKWRATNMPRTRYRPEKKFMKREVPLVKVFLFLVFISEAETRKGEDEIRCKSSMDPCVEGRLNNGDSLIKLLLIW